MVMLSQLQRFQIIDERGRRAPLGDLAVALLDEDYPPVTELIFNGADKRQKSLPWDAARGVDLKARCFRVADLDAGAETSTESLNKEVLLRRDVLDALVLDLQNRRAMRANDLWLEEESGRLVIRSVDTGLRSVLRRLSRGLLVSGPRGALYDWKYVEFLRGDPSAVRNGAGYNMHIKHLPPGEIALLSNSLPYLHAAELVTLLPDPVAADTLEFMPPERQLQVFEELETEQALKLLSLMAPDVATDLIGRLNHDEAQSLLERLSPDLAHRIIELLRYPESTVGGIMTNDVVSLPLSYTVKEAREELRERLKKPDFVFLIYVVDDAETKRLRGLISLRNLLTADDEEKLEELMDPYLTTLHALDSAADASYKVISSHLAGMPVVGREGELLGVVTVDAAVAQVAPSNWTDQAPRVFS